MPLHTKHMTRPVPRHLLQIFVLIQSLSYIVGESLETNMEILCNACFILFILATFSGAMMPAPWQAEQSTMPVPWHATQCEVFRLELIKDAACKIKCSFLVNVRDVSRFRHFNNDK